MSDALPPPPDDPGTATTTSSNGSSSRAYDRVPPHSLEAEVSVLGAALLSANAASDVTELLRPEDFYRNAHRLVFDGIGALIRSDGVVDTVTITDWLARQDRLDEVGGAAAIYDLTVAVPTAANASYYARIVRQKALLRRLIDVGTEVVRLGYDGSDDAETVVDRAESLVYEVAQTGTASEYARLGDLLTDSFEMIEKLADQRSEVTGLPTGFNDLDRLTAGLQPQNLVIIAARPAMGKCLRGDTRIMDADTGATHRLEDLVREGMGGRRVLALDERGRMVPAEVSDAVDNGVRQTYRVRTRSGRVVHATDNHPFRTLGGWRELKDLTLGERIAVPRRYEVQGNDPLANAEVVLLAYLLGDGCLRDSLPSPTTASPVIEAEATAAAAAFGAATSIRRTVDNRASRIVFRGAHERVTRQHVGDRVGVSSWTVSEVASGRAGVSTATRRCVSDAMQDLGYTGAHHPNHLVTWLQELGVWGLGSHDKFIPGPVFTLPREQLATFLSRLFATDGSAWVSERHGYFGISYTSVSERKIHDIQHLLLRFDILSRVRHRQVAYRDGHNEAFELEIRDAEHALRFLDEIGIFSKEVACATVREAASRRVSRHTNTDLMPREVWEIALRDKGIRSWADVSEAAGRRRGHNWHVGKRSPSRRLVAELSDAIDSRELRDLSSSDVLWDEIVSVEPAGIERVYDLTVPGFHNFVADDMVVHNSSLALGLAHYVTAKIDRPAILFSLEMSKLEIVNRLLSAEARIDSSRLRTGRLDDADWLKLGDALGSLSEAPLFIDDTPSITLNEIRAKCRRLKQKHGLDLVIVDYLQLMQSHRRVDNRQQEVAEISRGLKMLAKELDAPVIALSQLSRQPESRTDKRPMLADLRESGSIEQDADIVGFIYRDEVYDEDSPDRGIAELIIAKHRNGATGVVKLAFLDHLTTFANLARTPAGSPSGGPSGPQTPV